MTLDEYQCAAWKTAEMPGKTRLERLSVFGLGVAGEAGEVADIIKKFVGHDHPIDDNKLIKELGDVLWYISCIARERGFGLSVVANANILKLKKRYPDGFSAERSLNRSDK